MTSWVRVVAAGPGQDRHAAFRFSDDQFDDPNALLLGQRRSFAGRAARDEEMDAGVDLPARKAADGCFINRAAARKRRDEGGSASSKGLTHGCSPIFPKHPSS